MHNFKQGTLTTCLLLALTLGCSHSAIAAQNEHRGQFKLHYAATKEKTYNDIAEVFKADSRFESIIQGLNHEFVLSEDIAVEFEDKDGPLYDPATKAITMSYGFMAYLSALYLEKYPNASNEAMISFLIGSAVFLFYHEMAHALIDVFQLPIVGNEETAADNLAAVVALEYTQEGYAIVMSSADIFDLLSGATQTYDPEALWDEHALDSQRFYNVLCLAYGKYPKEVENELMSYENKDLHRFIGERGSYCGEEYQRQLNSWLKLLEPHMISE